MTTPLHETLGWLAELPDDDHAWQREGEANLIAAVNRAIAVLARFRKEMGDDAAANFTPAEIAEAKRRSCLYPENHVHGQKCVSCAWGLEAKP